MSKKAIYTPVDPPKPRQYQVLLKGGPADGRTITVDSLSRWIALPLETARGLGQVRYRRDPTQDGVQPIYVYASEH